MLCREKLLGYFAADMRLCFRIFKSSFSHDATQIWKQFEPLREKNQQFAYAKTKMQISFAITAKLISAFVFATWIVQNLFFLNTKFPASSHLQ